MMRRYWDYYFNPLKVDGPLEIIFRSALLTFFIIGVVILIFGFCGHCHANEYVITYYGQGVISIEHDGVIYVQGKGEPEKSGKISTVQSFIERESNLQWFIDREDYVGVGRVYEEMGDMENANIMYLKDIEQELAKSPPYYKGAAYTALHYLKDTELALEYYEKYAKQVIEQNK